MVACTYHVLCGVLEARCFWLSAAIAVDHACLLPIQTGMCMQIPINWQQRRVPLCLLTALPDVEYIDGGSGRSLSFTDMLVRKRGVSDSKHPSNLVIGVVEIKGYWQLKMDGSRSLLDCLQDEQLGPSAANVMQQVIARVIFLSTLCLFEHVFAFMLG